MPARPSKPVLAVLATVLLATSAVWLTAAEKKTAPAAAPRPALTVTVVKPEPRTWPETIAANGNLAAWQESLVGSEAGGLRLVEVHAAVGDVVRRGQLLARFADESVLAEIARERAAVAEAEATLAEARPNAERARQLDGSGAMSSQQIAQFVALERTAEARLAAARARLDGELLRLKQTRIEAPDDGVISARQATLGAVMPAGQELFRLVRQGRLEWRAEVTAGESARIRPGQAASIVAANGKALVGKVRQVAPTVDAQTRNLIVYVDLKTADMTLADAKPGMFARGELQFGSRPVLTVPGAAVVLRDGFAHIFALGDGDKVKLLRVSTGRQAEGRIEVAGLPAETRVVAGGAGFLADGDTVRVVAE